MNDERLKEQPDSVNPLRSNALLSGDYCDCNCHVSGAIHFDACCQGQCEGCGHFIVFGRLSGHRRECPDWVWWANSQKRRFLRENQLWDDFVATRDSAR